MDKILVYILTYASFLYKKLEFKFVDSLVNESFGGDAYLVLSSQTINLRFVSDRDQLFLDFQSRMADSGNSWHSIDVVRELISGEISDSAELNEDYANFLETKFQDISCLFSEENAIGTVKKLKALEKKRSKRMFR